MAGATSVTVDTMADAATTSRHERNPSRKAHFRRRISDKALRTKNVNLFHPLTPVGLLLASPASPSSPSPASGRDLGQHGGIQLAHRPDVRQGSFVEVDEWMDPLLAGEWRIA
mmetsp:Transcript_17516/g.42076  ORF Transcript_17516/g.42076 Transcript_17516/m.42076 type:complete len:113 (+) Transcript_17516:105-443(+)